MSYPQSSSSFYQSSLDRATDGYGIAYDEGSGNYSSYESTSTTGYGVGGGEAFLDDNGGFDYQGLPGAALTNGGFDHQGLSGAALTNGDGYTSSSSEQQLSSYATDTTGFYKDPNPQIIRRPALGGLQLYAQRISVKFLQPPPPPPPGPLIIKEVRPPQPPPPPPLYIRQRPPPPPLLPPIVIREAPPKMPPAVGTKVINKMLPPLPVPPRSVIIERLPPLPPKPRDVIVERWLPYRTTEKRRVVIQRAPPAIVQKPRNIIIYYEPPKAQILRRFQNLGVQLANPADYVARYGTQLEDAQTLITHARQFGVVEDISPPASSASTFQSSSYENYQSDDIAIDGISANNYESSSSYNTIDGTAGLESPFTGFGFVNNTNDIFDGSNTSYELYSSQQINS